MAIYEYEDQNSGETFEVQQSMVDSPYTHKAGETWMLLAPEFKGQTVTIEEDGEDYVVARPVKRLISSSSGGFRLVSGPSGGWSAQGYSKPEGHRQAEAMLGRKLHKPIG